MTDKSLLIGLVSLYALFFMIGFLLQFIADSNYLFATLYFIQVHWLIAGITLCIVVVSFLAVVKAKLYWLKCVSIVLFIGFLYCYSFFEFAISTLLLFGDPRIYNAQLIARYINPYNKKEAALVSQRLDDDILAVQYPNGFVRTLVLMSSCSSRPVIKWVDEKTFQADSVPVNIYQKLQKFDQNRCFALNNKRG